MWFPRRGTDRTETPSLDEPQPDRAIPDEKDEHRRSAAAREPLERTGDPEVALGAQT